MSALLELIRSYLPSRDDKINLDQIIASKEISELVERVMKDEACRGKSCDHRYTYVSRNKTFSSKLCHLQRVDFVLHAL